VPVDTRALLVELRMFAMTMADMALTAGGRGLSFLNRIPGRLL
jgi:hypothetical protein